MKISKTNAMRQFDKYKMKYEVYTYDASDGNIDGISVAKKCNQDPKRVYKTLVARGQSKKIYVFVINVLNELDLKTVLAESKDKEGRLPSVIIDNIQASYDATKSLIGKGLKNIAFVGVNKDASNAWGERHIGYEKALEESGLSIDEDLAFFKDLKVKSGYKAVESFLATGKKFDGVVCSSDEIAMGVINALRENGLKVPEDVSVIGFNDNAVASYFYPKITTVKQPSYDMGSVAMRMLIKILNNKPLEQDQYVLDYKLIQRESSK